MRSPNEKKMFELLLDEVENTLQDIERRCLKLENSDQDKELQVIFRAAHNVKGAAQLYGLTEFGTCVHSFEDLLSTVQKMQKETGKKLSTQTIDIFLFSQGFLWDWVQNLRQDEKYLADGSVLQAILKGHIEDLKSGKVQFEGEGTTLAETPTNAVSPTNSTPKEDAKTSSAPNAASNPEPKATPAASGTSGPVSSSDVKPQPVAATSTAAAPTPATPQQVAPTPTPTPLQAPPTAPPAAPSSAAPPSAPSSAKTKKRPGTLRISSDRLDEIMQLIGELSIHQGIFWHNYQNNTFNILNCKNAVVLNQKTLKDLYDLVLTLRMQSADTLFQRIERTARDLAREQRKKVQIELIGADTPLDKTVIELIMDPMTHLVRNAIDHGIETEEERKALGKNPAARLTIQTQHDLGHVIISISDDGRGMDPQVIYDKAVKKGLVEPGKKLSEQEIFQLIYLPGFSTREQVTEISGRGVGMDVVIKAIQTLGGRVDTSSKKGNGTTFQITLPASVEIIEGLRVRVCNNTYIIPRQDVAEIIDLNEFSVETMGRGEAFKHRESVVPVEDLADYIGFSETVRDSNARNVGLIIRLADRSRLALRVDAVLGQQQIVVRPMNEQLAKIPGFTGVTILGNGEPAMIISPSIIGECYLKWTESEGRAA